MEIHSWVLSCLMLCNFDRAADMSRQLLSPFRLLHYRPRHHLTSRLSHNLPSPNRQLAYSYL